MVCQIMVGTLRASHLRPARRDNLIYVECGRVLYSLLYSDVARYRNVDQDRIKQSLKIEKANHV